MSCSMYSLLFEYKLEMLSESEDLRKYAGLLNIS